MYKLISHACMQKQRNPTRQNQHNGSFTNKQHGSKEKKPRTRVMLQGWPRSAPRLPQAACSPPHPGRIQSGISLYLGGPQRSGEGGVSGSFWSPAESKAACLKPNLVMLQSPRSSSAEAAVSTTRHSPRAAGKCGRVAVEITAAKTAPRP